jgi:pilus assembly protein CpaB
MKKLLPIVIAVPVFLLSLLFMRPEATSPVVLAAIDLPEGHILAAADIQVRQVPKSQAPQDAFSDPSQLVGQTLRVFRGAGDVIKPSNLGGEVIILAPDERAVAIHVTDAAGLAGLIRPGDSVGVTAVIDSPDGPFAKTVASGLRVLYISPEFKAAQGAASAPTSSTSNSPFAGGGSSSSQRPRELEGTVVLAVPVDAITIGYDFSTFGVNSESRLVSLTDLLPALDLVDTVQLSLFLEPDSPESFITSGLLLPNLVITPGPTPTATPCPGGVCADVSTPNAIFPLP